MKKKLLLFTLVFAGLFLGVGSAIAAPHHGGPHGSHVRHGHHGHIHRPPHHGHHIRYYRSYYNPYYYGPYYPAGIGFGFSSGGYYPPIHHHGGLGASFHISI